MGHWEPHMLGGLDFCLDFRPNTYITSTCPVITYDPNFWRRKSWSRILVALCSRMGPHSTISSRVRASMGSFWTLISLFKMEKEFGEAVVSYLTKIPFIGYETHFVFSIPQFLDAMHHRLLVFFFVFVVFKR